jgi:hypothetical protein
MRYGYPTRTIGPSNAAPTNARFQGFQLRARHSEWHRIDGHDQEMTGAMFGQHPAVCARQFYSLVSFDNLRNNMYLASEAIRLMEKAKQTVFARENRAIVDVRHGGPAALTMS